jgi:FkbM family methyltransferase
VTIFFSKTIETNIPGQEPIRLKAWYKEFESYYPNCELITKKWFVDNVKADWDIIDCGASIGYYSILFSRLAPQGMIYALEPTITAKMLKKNLEFNKINNVRIFQIAAGKVTGKIQDSIYRIWGNEPEHCEYNFVKLDDFVEHEKIIKIDCIKIDVDSFDFEVLQGAENILKNFNPYIIVELNHALNKRNQSNMQALEWMKTHGYDETLCLEYENFVFKKGVDFLKKNEMKVSFSNL